jgi:hypothetical protein
VRAAEWELLDQARNRRLDRDDYGTLSDLELLASLQHHGAATRLLDVSVDPAIALWFASPGNVSGLVLGFSLKHLSEKTAGDVSPASPFLWRPPPVDLRIRHQRGQFVVSKFPAKPRRTQGSYFTDVGVDLDLKWQSNAKIANLFQAKSRGRPANESPSVIGVRIRAKLKSDLRDYLQRGCGFDYTSIFPDLDGFAQAWGPDGP